MAGKKRLDVLLTEQGLAESRQKAQAIIMAGQVFWEGRRMDKAGRFRARRRQVGSPRSNAALCQPGWVEVGESHGCF